MMADTSEYNFATTILLSEARGSLHEDVVESPSLVCLSLRQMTIVQRMMDQLPTLVPKTIQISSAVRNVRSRHSSRKTYIRDRLLT